MTLGSVEGVVDGWAVGAVDGPVVGDNDEDELRTVSDWNVRQVVSVLFGLMFG